MMVFVVTTTTNYFGYEQRGVRAVFANETAAAQYVAKNQSKSVTYDYEQHEVEE